MSIGMMTARLLGIFMNRKWTEAENKIILDNYAEQSVIAVTGLLHTAGFDDRFPLSIARQASKLGVKARRTNNWTSIYRKKRKLEEIIHDIGE